MLLDTRNKDDAIKLNEQVRYLINKGSICELTEKRNNRTNAQNAARWKYLTMIEELLDERGHGWQPPGLDFEIKFTKDSLYEIYWQNARRTLYPNMKKQLDTKQFSDVVELVLDIMAQIFDIHISFPNIKDYLTSKG